MRYLNKIKAMYKLILSLCFLFITSISCTDYMDGLNVNQKLITDKQLEMDANEGGFMLPGMQIGIVDIMRAWVYEVQTCYCADNYAGYCSIQYPEQNNINLGTYGPDMAWLSDVWTSPTTLVLDQWVGMKKKGFDKKYPDLFAMATIFKVFAGHRIVDMLGPIPYSLYGTASDVKFDSEEESYNLFFTELTDAVAALTKAETDNPAADKIRYAKFDKSRYGGDYATWIKVANTLRLRLAMRISKVNPAKAKAEAEAAVADGGVLTTKQGSFEMSTGSVHPIATITESWQEIRLNAAIESFLGGYNDPRLPKYGKPSIYNGGEIKGMRSGSIQKTGNYIGFSQLNFTDNPYVKLMDVAESYFLLAEGALRGWNMGGTPQEFYEQGIRASFGANKVAGVDEYINNSTSVPKAYVDPVNPENNALPRTTITIKWDENATPEQKLERIITQKWIAMYPEGYEAWSEFRRTGYPKLWPVAENNSGGIIPQGEFIKRHTYPNAIRNSTQDAMNAAIASYLNGKDSMFEPIWWDVD
jgi:hypothetical protein